MTWVFVALLGYFFNAGAALFDKYLLSDRIQAPAVYAFFVSLFSLFALGFAPFGFHLVDWNTCLILLFSGALFVYGLVAFYAAVKHNDVSRVAPLLGTIISLVAFLALFSPATFDQNAMGFRYILSLCLLVGGGLLISFDLPLKKGEHFSKLVLIAGIAMGLSLLLLKEGFSQSDFVNGIVWSRLGMFLGGISLLVIPVFRKQIMSQLLHFSNKPKHAGTTSFLFVLNKTCAGVGTFLVSYATYLGSLTFVQALSGMQYVFILLLAFPLAWHFPKIFGEKLHFWDWFQKAFAVALIALGLWLATLSGVELLQI